LLLRLGLESLLLSKADISTTSALAGYFLSCLDSVSVPSNNPPPVDILPVVYLSRRHLEKLRGLLSVFLECRVPGSDSIRSCLYNIATTCLSFLEFDDTSVSNLAWDVLAFVMQIESNAISDLLEQIKSKIHRATIHFLQTLVRINFELRNGVDFLKDWALLFDFDDSKSHLAHPDVAKV
jgi:hypothetical protein